MIKATDKWFRLLKGTPLNEQASADQLVQIFKATYKKKTGDEYKDENSELQQIIYEEIKKTLTEEWWYERRGQDNIAYNKNLGKKYRNMKHVKSGPPFNCDPPSKMAAGIKPAKGSKC